MEDELRGKGCPYQVLLDSMPCAALLLRPSTRVIVAANLAAVKVGAVPGSKCFATWGQRDNPCPGCPGLELWKTGQLQWFKLEAGEVVWEVYGAPMGPDLYLHYAFDITGRRQMEKTRQESESRLCSVYNTIQAGIVLQSADGAILDANQVACDIFGLQLDEIKAKTAGDPIWQMVLEDGTPVPGTEHPSMITIRTGQPVRNAVRGLFANEPDRILWLLINTQPRLDPTTGNLREVTITLQDITAQKQVQTALEKLLSLQKAALESTADGLLVVNLEGEIVTWNQKFVDMWRIPKDIINSRNNQQVRAYATEQLQDSEEFLAKAIDLFNHPEREADDRLFFKDGRVFELFSRPQRLYNRVVGRVLSFRDITAQIRDKEALRQSEQKYRDLYKLTHLIVNNAPDLIWSKGLDNKFILVNQAMCNKLLMIDSPDEALGKTDMFFAEKERQAGFEHTFGETCVNSDAVVKETKTPQRFLESGMIRGQELVLDVYKAPLFNDDGEMIGTVGCARDVTREKEIEKTLSVIEEKFRLLVSQIPAVVFRGYGDWSIDPLDEKVEALTGYSKEDFESRRIKWCDLIPAEDLDYAAKVFREALKTGQSYVQEHRLRKSDGEIIWVQCRGQIFCDDQGKVDSISGVAFDITARRRGEEAVKESLRLRQQILDTIPSPIFYQGIDGRYQGVNQAFLQFYGKTTEQVVGKTVYEVFPKEIADMYVRMDQDLFQHPGIQVYEFHSYDVHGQRREMSLHKATFQDKNGNIAGLAGIMIDITEAKRAEKERLRFSKLESLSTLAGGIAHDFNNILTAILGNIGLAMLEGKKEDQARERLAQAEQACLRAQSLSQQLLTFAKGGAPIIKISSMAKLLRESINLALSGSKSRYKFSIPEDLWFVEADEGQIGQVISNLVINADQAMPEGGVIKIEAENFWVKQGSNLPLAQRKYVKVTCADQGIGIPPKYLDKIFDPYFSTKQKGSGLGLATAYSIIQNHSGYMKAESQVGEGTTFYVYLPAIDQGVPADESETAKPTRGQGKVLVMDDDEMVREVLGKMLNHLGYEVIFANDGAQAIEKFAEARESGQPLAAVILDLTIPGGMGGKETIKELLKIDPQVKAIVSSGYSDDPIMADFQKYGYYAVLTKPYRISELGKILQRVIPGENPIKDHPAKRHPPE